MKEKSSQKHRFLTIAIALVGIYFFLQLFMNFKPWAWAPYTAIAVIALGWLLDFILKKNLNK